MDTTATARRVSVVRKVGWLAVASMLALALLAPSATNAAKNTDSFFGAIWTSLSDGATVNANLYDNKSLVYLNGGPQNCGNSNGLPDGDYYFQVSDPSGATLLSQDAIKYRQVHVANGVISGVSGSGNHAVGTTPAGCPIGALPVRLMPYATTPNSGGEYSVDLAKLADAEACQAFDRNSTTFNFLDCTNTKNDNFKVKSAAPAIHVVKVADPTVVPATGGEVTYTYTVTNPGDTALTGVYVEDDKCDSPAYTSGDTNGNQVLELNETWIFHCSTLITVPTVNTAIAHGFDGPTQVTSQDQATVTVSSTTTTSSSISSTSTSSSTTTSTTTTNFVQTVGGATDVPSVTLPPTDSFGGSSGPSSDSWRILLIVGAVLLASVLVLNPNKASRRS